LRPPRCNQTTHICTYSTESGTSVEVPDSRAAEYSDFSVASPPNGTVRYPLYAENRAYFSVFDMLSVTQSHRLDSTSTETSPDDKASPVVVGNECALWFCIKSCSISVNEGYQRQTLQGSWSEIVPVERSSRTVADYIFANDGIPEYMNTDSGTWYMITHEAMTALRGFMSKITTGRVHADPNTVSSSSDWAEVMWNATTTAATDREGGHILNDWVSTLALSLTADIRQNGRLQYQHSRPHTQTEQQQTQKLDSAPILLPLLRKTYHGSAVKLTPFVKVQWLWLIYPGIMMLLGSLYLARTIDVSARAGVPAWKGGVLPMLFSRIDDDIRERVGSNDDHIMNIPGGLDSRTRDVRVSMYYRPSKNADVGTNQESGCGTWRFRAVENDEDDLRG